MLNANVPAWFEIPASRLDRAQNFYETILGVSLKRESMGGGDMAVFPYGGKPNATGALIQHEDCEPSVLGSTVYLNVSDLRPVLTERRPILLSIAAGIRTSNLQNWCPGLPVVRAMPNLPARVGAGVTGLYAPPDTNAAERQLAEWKQPRIEIGARVILNKNEENEQRTRDGSTQQ